MVVVVGGTALAVVQTGAAVTSDLGIRASAALGSQQFGWANVGVDGRDVVLSGTATTQQMIDDAVERLSVVHGVGGVTSHVALAEFVRPFALTATVNNGQVILGGAYPSEPVHAALLSAAGSPTVDRTKLYSGAPDAFEAGAKFGLAALANLDQGEMQLSDVNLSLSGRAKSSSAFDALKTLQQSLPPAITLASLNITPPVASPYVWIAKFDGTSVTITGDTPSTDLADRLRALAPANIPVSMTLQLSSGEPADFDATALVLLKNLLTLENGEAAINDGAVTLSGAPATTAIADDVDAALKALGGTATLEPPQVADYTFSIDKAGDKLTFAGFVPDGATRDKLASEPGADVTHLSLGRGSPDHFGTALDFGLGALAHLSEGRFAVKGDKMSLGGRAATVADFKAVEHLARPGAPQGFSLAAAELHPPVAKPFTFTAIKEADGAMTIAGFYPDGAALTRLTGKLKLAGNTAEPADGAPDNFTTQAGKGLDVLALLDTGTVNFDGSNWSIEGTVDTPQKGFAADAAYSIAGLRTAGWTYTVKLPEAQVAAALPIIAPYVWRAQKSADGSLSFTGFAPSDGFKNLLRVRVPAANDSTMLGAGAPADFGSSASAGLDALMALDEGSLGLSGARWTLTGTTAAGATRESIQNALSAKVNGASWVVAIQAGDSAAVVTPYLWSATKAADGSVELNGYTPAESLKSFAAVRAGTVSRDNTAIASGEPAGFSDDLLAGLDALSQMTQGKATFDGSKWSLSGEAASDEQGQAAIAALAKGSKGGALWTNSLTSFALTAPALLEASSSSAEQSSVQASSIATPDIISLEPSSEPQAASSAEAASSEGASSSELTVAPSSEQPVSEPVSSEASSSPADETSSSEPLAADREVVPTKLDVTTPLPDNLVFAASKPRNGAIGLSGAVPAEATAAYFGVLAGGVKVDKLVATPGLPDDFIANGTAGLTGLAELAEGQLGFDGSRWWLHGKAKQQPVKDDVDAKVAALPKGADWSLDIGVLAPLDVCRDTVDALAARNAILFKAGKAELMASSLPVLDELASDLAICPNTYVHVQGHTDADGNEDVNLALSVSRAEAVVVQLVKRGVSEDRLYAEGFGETAPIASNDTKDGKAKNRRIAFAITEE